MAKPVEGQLMLLIKYLGMEKALGKEDFRFISCGAFLDDYREGFRGVLGSLVMLVCVREVEGVGRQVNKREIAPNPFLTSAGQIRGAY